MSAPISGSATVVSIGRQCRRQSGGLAHDGRHGCVPVPPDGSVDAGWLTGGDGAADGGSLGVGLGVCGVGTGAGHWQLGTGAGGAASAPGTAGVGTVPALGG